MNKAELTNEDKNAIRKARVLHRGYYLVFNSENGKAILEDLENNFEVHLPVFQGKAGSFDPLDAMRRDAYREVMLYIRRRINLGTKINEQDND